MKKKKKKGKASVNSWQTCVITNTRYLRYKMMTIRLLRYFVIWLLAPNFGYQLVSWFTSLLITIIVIGKGKLNDLLNRTTSSLGHPCKNKNLLTHTITPSTCTKNHSRRRRTDLPWRLRLWIEITNSRSKVNTISLVTNLNLYISKGFPQLVLDALMELTIFWRAKRKSSRIFE